VSIDTSKKNALVAPDFRKAATNLADQLQQADRNVMSLVSELDAAGQIIQTILRHLTVAQKLHISIDLESRGIISDGMTRHHERQYALLMARGYLAKGQLAAG
jgi:pantothenate synthetase